MSFNFFHRRHRFHRMRHFSGDIQTLYLRGLLDEQVSLGLPRERQAFLCLVMSVGSLAAGGAIY